MESIYVPDPVVSLAIAPKKTDTKSLDTLTKALKRFSKEDPTFVVKYDEETEERTINGMGELHLEIYAQRLEREYNAPITLGRPKVVFYETFLEGESFEYQHKKQTGGRGQYGKAWGVLRPEYDPAKGNFDFIFKDNTTGNELSKKYVPSIQKGFKEAAKIGPTAGKPVVGFRVELDGGQEHMIDSSDYAFQYCGEGCMQQLYSLVGTKVIGPVMKVQTSVPSKFQNAVVDLLSQRKGTISNQEESLDYITYDAEVALYDMFGYTADLRQITEGKGEYTMEFLKYDYVEDDLEEKLTEEHRLAVLAAAQAKAEKSKKKKAGR